MTSHWHQNLYQDYETVFKTMTQITELHVLIYMQCELNNCLYLFVTKPTAITVAKKHKVIH